MNFIILVIFLIPVLLFQSFIISDLMNTLIKGSKKSGGNNTDSKRSTSINSNRSKSRSSSLTILK
ncbi:hypothetical protein CLPU_15c00010 [Gottschalkia purinilytica]|uniref:Uncharacterized protein n=1 Tax=Gottschalkia purinilytica TaxID=1503 RepID=A0A0L0W7U8_GOTPU|nr:hypothetical protein [Gottschalkia purinilytica]KNF07507.1 hypothetical protein CLPU_15c00010 [Gottschalkia purinilytica]